jgi:hypothetical protein
MERESYLGWRVVLRSILMPDDGAALCCARELIYGLELSIHPDQVIRFAHFTRRLYAVQDFLPEEITVDGSARAY